MPTSLAFSECFLYYRDKLVNQNYNDVDLTHIFSVLQG